MTNFLSKIANRSILSILVGAIIGSLLSIGWFVWGWVWSWGVIVLSVIFGVIVFWASAQQPWADAQQPEASAQQPRARWEKILKGTRCEKTLKGMLALGVILGIILVIFFYPPISPFKKEVVVNGILYQDDDANGEKEVTEKEISQENLIMVSEYKSVGDKSYVTLVDGRFVLTISDTLPNQFCLVLPDRALAIQENVVHGGRLVLHIGEHSKEEPGSIPNKLSRTLQENFWPIETHLLQWVVAIMVLVVIVVVVYKVELPRKDKRGGR